MVKAFVREDHEIEKFHGISKYVYTLFTKAEKIVAWNSPVMQFTIYTAMLLMVAIGGRNCIRCDGNRRNDQCDRVCVPDHDSSDDGYIRICYDHDHRSVYRPYYGSSGGSSGDADKKNAITEVADGEIRFEHVDFSYTGEGGNLSLKDVNLHIKSGQTIGIIGGTGSAKSTLVQLIRDFMT